MPSKYGGPTLSKVSLCPIFSLILVCEKELFPVLPTTKSLLFSERLHIREGGNLLKCRLLVSKLYLAMPSILCPIYTRKLCETRCNDSLREGNSQKQGAALYSLWEGAVLAVSQHKRSGVGCIGVVTCLNAHRHPHHHHCHVSRGRLQDRCTPSSLFFSLSNPVE